MSLYGPFPILEVFDTVAPGRPGVYVLGRDHRHANYAGRSDTDVRARIPQSAAEGSGYRWFWFDYATSPRDAYLKECILFHQLGGALDNSYHPAVPAGQNWRCPVEGCHWS